MSELQNLKLLIVDDEMDIANYLSHEFSALGVESSTAYSGNSAFELFCQKEFDIVITDIRMPDGDGLELLKKVKEKKPKTEVILISGFSDVETASQARSIGALGFSPKPLDIDNIMKLVKLAYERVNW